MSVAETILLTTEGWEQLNQELARCKATLYSRLSSYRDYTRGSEPGDAAVIQEQQELTATRARMAYLEGVLSRAVPVAAADRTPGVVGVGSSVRVQWEDGEEETYLVVGPPEVNPASNRISYESPVGAALMGRKQGEWIEVVTPAGVSRMRILAVN